jgi:hypothetical protein
VQLSNNQQAFFALVRAGLWEKEVLLASFGQIDFNEILRLSEEQSVVGLVEAGLEHAADVKLPIEEVLQFVGQALQLKQQNQAMNAFIGKLVEKMRTAGIYTLLLKGQGVAQCYEKPLCRSCGDVDLFLNEDNYKRAKELLVPIASDVEKEYVREKHLGMTIDGFVVELHGTLYNGLSSKIESSLDGIKKAVFFEGKVRSWMNGRTQIFLPSADEDVVYVFTHMLQHFFKEGLGLRQVCDWCRLLWTYKDTLNHSLIESRLRKMGLMTEWKAFGAFAVDFLGIPADAMPFYSSSQAWKRKAKRICKFVLDVGNMGHNRDNSYFEKPFLIRKMYSFGRRCGDLMRHGMIFPLDSLRFFPAIVFNGLRSAVKGEG